MNLQARIAAEQIVTLIESRAPSLTIHNDVKSLIDALGGLPTLAEDMSAEETLLYILALHLRKEA